LELSRSAPRTTLLVSRLQNAYLRDSIVVLDASFATASLLELNSLGFLEAVHSLRVLDGDDVFVAVQATPAAVLPLHPLYPHMRAALELGAVRGAFWDATSVHLVAVQLSLPCAAWASLGAHKLRARGGAGGACENACAVLHLSVLERWDANAATQWIVAAGALFLKDARGLHEATVPALLGAHYQLRLHNGAQVTRMQEVALFSSVQFDCDARREYSGGEPLRAAPQWQRLRRVVSAHSVPPRLLLQLQVTRGEDEPLAEARSLAVDALKLLVVLTGGVPLPLPRGGAQEVHLAQPLPPRAVSAWIPHVHCCDPATDMLMGVCPLEAGGYSVGSQLQCEYLAVLNGAACAARTFVAARGSCHRHSACAAHEMRSTAQTGVTLMLGVAPNFCPPGAFPRDRASPDTSSANCAATPDAAPTTISATVSAAPADLPDAAPGPYFTPLYVPKRAELDVLDLGSVVFGENIAHTDNW